MTNCRNSYRPEIDGLRGLAVIAVMGFHAGFPRFGGGYTGVDIFFVISGYLITRIIAQEHDAGYFKFYDFYLRRALRILPALVVMLIICLPLALLMPDPDQAKSVGIVLASSLAFSVNIYFWKRSADYFSADVHANPLMHLWSLSVEEQFYLFYPLIFLFLARFWPRWLPWILFAGFLGSLMASEWASSYGMMANYFLLPMRAWELLAGALVALSEKWWGRDGLIQPWASELLSWLGLGLCTYTVVFYSSNKEFPGVAAIPVVAGPALLIIFARAGKHIRGILGSRPLVFVGLISYSAYLWHQPLLGFARSYLITDLSTGTKLGLLALAFGLGALSWRFVETPFRRSPKLRTPPVLIVAAATICSLFVAGLALWASDGFPSRFSDRHLALMRAPQAGADRERPCFFTPDVESKFADGCIVGETGPLTTAILGDSHAVAIATAIEDVMIARHERALLLTQAGCPPTLVNPNADPSSFHCARFNQRAFSYLIERRDIPVVLLAARWAYHVEQTRYDNGEGGIEDAQPLRPSSYRSRAEMAAAFAHATETLLRAGKRVLLVYPIPEAGWVVPTAIAKRELWGISGLLSINEKAFQERNRRAVLALDAIGERPGLVRIYPSRSLCGSVVIGRCIQQFGSAPLYFDDDHLSPEGARFALHDLADAFASQGRFTPNR